MKKMWMFLIGFILAAGFVQADSIGMVVAVQGAVTAIDESGAVRELAMKSEILLNDTVKTGPASRLQIMLNDDSLLAQGENSEMTIDEYVYNPEEASENAFGAKLGKGLFRTVTGKITDMNPDRFKVKTARATIGIRGCDLGFEITPTEDNISIMAIPAGKQIFINPLLGKKSLVVETPRFVTVDDRGLIMQRDLTGGDRSSAQQATTPNAGAPELDSGDLREVDPGELNGSSLIDGGESPVKEGSIIQDTEQGHSETYSEPYDPNLL